MVKTYKPYMNVPTGEFIKEELEVRHWRQEDLARILGREPKTVNELINNKQSITFETALLLSQAFGQSPQYWLNLDTNYRLRLREPGAREQEVAIKSMIFQHMPIREMIRKGWLESYRSFNELLQQVKEFWGVDTPDQDFFNRAPLPCFRRSEAFALHEPYARTWLHMAQKCARTHTTGAFARKKLQELARQMIPFTVADDGVSGFLQALNQTGVEFLVLRHLQKTHIDGAAFFDNGNPVLVYTQRYDRIDNFWFTIAHELAHILRDLNSRDDIFIDNLESLTSTIERRANEYAESLLGIDKILKHFRQWCYIHEARVREYSQATGIHPAIIVGSLQYHNLMSKKNLNKYKTRVSTLIPDRFYVEKCYLKDPS